MTATRPPTESLRGSILVVGGGIAGLSAAIEAAEAGCAVVLIEHAAHFGGRVAQLHQYFPKLCPPLCGLELNLRRLRAGNRLECHTLTEVRNVIQLERRLRVQFRQAPRFVNAQCSACGACAKVCPVKRPNAVNFGMNETEAIYLPHPTAHPALYAIDANVCLGESCGLCVKACTANAINLSMAARDFELEVDAVIWATGWRPYEPTALRDLGFGAHPDIITNMMMERFASPQGPTGGRILCPSDGRDPKRVAFVQCAGSRDTNHLDYCSGVCCLASAKQARYVRAACPDAEISIHYIDRRATGNYERFLTGTDEDAKTIFVPGKVAKIGVETGKPVLEFEDLGAKRRSTEPVDLVVLATGMVPEQSDACSTLERDTNGFLIDEPSTTARRRLQSSGRQFAAGCAKQPSDVASAVRDATSAVARALAAIRS
jgi:quinone-modifying oxidoreductase, subunit QmoA